MEILGVDPSLTATGVCWEDRRAETWAPSMLSGPARLIYLRDLLLEVIGGMDLVVLEGYSYGSRGQSLLSAGELGGVLRVALHEAKMPWVEVPPSTLKKYATGKGNASKDQVLSAAVHRAGVEFQTSDEADAWWLRAMAVHHYKGRPVVEVPHTNAEARFVVDWPEVDGARIMT